MSFTNTTITVQYVTFSDGFNPTNTTSIGSSSTSNATPVMNGSGTNPLISLNSTSGTVSIQKNIASTSGALSVTLAKSGQLYVNSGAALSISGNVGGSGFGIEKAGGGTLILAGSNACSGTTTVSAGALIAGTNAPATGGGAFGNASSAITLGNAATTSNNSSASLLTGGAFAVGRSVTVANQATSGTYTIGGNSENSSTFSGAITINQPLTISQVSTTGSNTLNITGGISAGNPGTKTVTLAGPGAITVSTNAVANGLGAVAVDVTGGTITFTGAHSYTGGTTIRGGTLALSGSGAIANSPTITVAAGATFDVSAISGGFTLANGQTLSGGGSVTGPLTTAPGSFVAPGTSAGLLSVASGLTLTAGTYSWELGSLKDNSNGAAGIDFDQIALNGGSSDFNGGVVSLAFGLLNAADRPDQTSPNAFWTAHRAWTIITSSSGTTSGTPSLATSSYAAGDFFI